MAQQFLHGVETVVVDQGPRPVTEVKTAVIGLIGVAPQGPTNIPTLVRNDVEAAQFGKQLSGFDIPQALNFIFGHNAGTVVVINVFDPNVHTNLEADDTVIIANGKGQLAFAPIGGLQVKQQDGTATTYVKGTDYTLDEFGKIQVIAGRIPNGTVMKFDYLRFDPDTVTDDQLIGIVGVDGNRTGIKALDLASTLFGFAPKILVVPGKSGNKAVAEEMLSAAERLRAVALIDSVHGLSISQILGERGNATKAFGTASTRAVLLYPYLKGNDVAKDGQEDTNSDFPYSMFYAGLMAWTDNEKGYWDSPSNYNLKGVTGLERPISANLSDPNTDTNTLNAAGIVTVFNSYGTGWLAWGNRNGSYPGNTAQDSFIALLRTFDVVHESLEKASLPFVDRKITKSMIADILHQGNDFISVLVGRGALTQGTRVVFDKAENPVAQLNAGQAVFTIIKDAPTPAERITYKSVIDISLKTRALFQ